MKLVVALVLMALCLAQSVLADQGKPNYLGMVKVNKMYMSYDVNPDGTYSQQSEMVLEVMTEEGVKLVNNANINYSDSLQTVTDLKAFTLKKDGRKIAVPVANIQDRSVVGGGGPVFSDIRTKNIIFPDVAKGDQVAYSFTLIEKVPVFPGHFSLAVGFSKFMVYGEARIKVTVPVHSLDLKVFSSGVEGGTVKEADGRLQWEWNYQNPECVVPEADAVAESDYGARIYVSSFKNYGAIADAYLQRAQPKARVTGAVRALATGLTQGITDKREQAKVLYGWVVKNISYAGNLNGIGSVVPHDADTVLENRLGDCKDHTTLLQALLAAKSIDSTPVLVNLGNSFKLPEVPVPAVLNHVLTYIPSLELYLDSTSGPPFGILPIAVSGKPSIRVTNFQGITKIPPTDYRTTTSLMKMTLNIHEDGSADGETANTETGIFSTTLRGQFASLRPDMEDLAARKLIAAGGYTGTGTFVKPDSDKVSDRFTIGLKYRLSDALNLPGPGALTIAPIMAAVVPMSRVANVLHEPERKVDFGCAGHITTEEYVINFPPSVKVVALPKDVHQANTLIRYDATYRASGSLVTVTRKFESMEKENVCTPDDDKKFRAIAKEIARDIRGQILYQPAAP